MGLGYDNKSRNLSIGIIVTNIIYLIIFFMENKINVNKKIVLFGLIILVIINIILHIVLGVYYTEIRKREFVNNNKKNEAKITDIKRIHTPLGVISIIIMIGLIIGLINGI
jgi:heme/copper-type cytochrome/quinol oxidase subunit 2